MVWGVAGMKPAAGLCIAPTARGTTWYTQIGPRKVSKKLTAHSSSSTHACRCSCMTKRLMWACLLKCNANKCLCCALCVCGQADTPLCLSESVSQMKQREHRCFSSGQLALGVSLTLILCEMMVYREESLLCRLWSLNHACCGSSWEAGVKDCRHVTLAENVGLNGCSFDHHIIIYFLPIPPTLCISTVIYQSRKV